MFVRKVPNRSGSFSVQVISKHDGKYKVVKTFGSSKDKRKIDNLCRQAEKFINNPSWQTSLFSPPIETDKVVEDFLNQISNSTVRTIGPELIFGTLFDRLGFSIIKEDLFRHLVIARLAYPTSKLKTVDYLYRYQGTVTSPSTVYRFLDTLNEEYKTKVETIAYQYTKNTLKTITVIFYDLTTLCFETEDEDDLRKIGFSKDGKFKHPQIRVGLLVGKDGLPIGYDIFEGNTFEGKTLIPTLEKLEKQYNLGKPTVIADSGLLSKENLELLKTKGYQFIIGARIKNESDLVKDKILK